MNQGPHIIRLRAPWQVEREPTADTEARGLRHVRLSRRFNRPTGLGTGSRLLLAIEGLDSWIQVTLNGRALRDVAHDDPTVRFDLTDHVALHNQLTIQLALPHDADVSATIEQIERHVLASGLVRLEIHQPA